MRCDYSRAEILRVFIANIDNCEEQNEAIQSMLREVRERMQEQCAAVVLELWNNEYTAATTRGKVRQEALGEALDAIRTLK